MKKISVVLLIGFTLALCGEQGFAQITSEYEIAVIRPYHLLITFYKTTTLLFPYSIKSVDRGSKDVLAQKAKGVENVLQVKAGKPGFEQTNLTVITADGKLYSYIVDYTDKPDVLNIQFYDNKEDHSDALFSNATFNDAQIQAGAKKAAIEKRNIKTIADKSSGIKIQMDGLYIKDDVMFFRIKAQNKSDINYTTEMLRFYIRDEKKSKRTASQELEIRHLYVLGDTSVITAQSENVLVFALPKFTLPDKKYFAIELTEKGGGRNVGLRVHNKTIVRAKLLQ